MGKEITRFTGDYRFLSNFWPSPLSLGGIVWPTAEHAYQAGKSLDRQVREHVAGMETPGMAKRYGQAVVLRPDWEQVKKRIMLSVVLAKFSQDQNLGSLLVGTAGAYLEEGNTWHDNFWGACVCASCSVRVPEGGLNYLGILLMAVRDVIRID